MADLCDGGPPPNYHSNTFIFPSHLSITYPTWVGLGCVWSWVTLNVTTHHEQYEDGEWRVMAALSTGVLIPQMYN